MTYQDMTTKKVLEWFFVYVYLENKMEDFTLFDNPVYLEDKKGESILFDDPNFPLSYEHQKKRKYIDRIIVRMCCQQN